MFRKRTEVKIGVEVTKGTAVVPDRLIRAYDVAINNTSPFIARRPVGVLGGTRGQRGEAVGQVTLRTELRGDGAASGGELDAGLLALLLAAGMKNNAGVFTPSSVYGEHATVTVYFYEDGVLKGLSGCAADLVIEGEFGKPASVQATLSGVWIDPTDAAMPTVVHSTVLPPRLASASLSLQGYASLRCNRFRIAFNNTITPRADVNAAAGVLCYAVTDRDYTLELDPEQELVATHNFMGLWKAGTQGAFSLGLGSAAGNTITIAAPAAQYRQLAEGDRGGLLTYDLTAGLNYSSGDDELTITAT